MLKELVRKSIGETKVNSGKVIGSYLLFCLKKGSFQFQVCGHQNIYKYIFCHSNFFVTDRS